MRTTAAVGLVLFTVFVAGCTTQPPPSAPAAAPSAHALTGTSAEAAAGATGAGKVSATDTAWTQLMIALDERLLKALELVPDRTKNPQLASLAVDVAQGHRAELVQLRQLLARTEASHTNPHEGHDMPGMVTAEKLMLMRQAAGAAFDELLVKAMSEHFNQCLLLAGSEQEAGSEPATRALAEAIEKTRLHDLERLRRIPASG